MESLKSQLSLRSLDVSGRPAGTGRPSSRPAPVQDFAQSLARDLDQRLETARAEERRARQQDERSSRARVAESTTQAALGREPALEPDGRRVESTRSDSRVHRAQVSRDDIHPRPDSRAAGAERGNRDAGDPAGAPPPLVQDGGDQAPDGPDPAATDPAVPASPLAVADGTLGGGARQGAAKPPAGVAAPGAPLSSDGAGGAAGTPVGLAGRAPAGPEAGVAVVAPGGKVVAPEGKAGATNLSASTASIVQGGGESDGTGRSTATPRGSAPSAVDIQRAEEILQQVRINISPTLRQVTLQLQPPHLGRVGIRVRIENGTMTAVLRAEQPETLAVLERHVPELRAMLSKNGIETHEFDFGLAWQGPDAGGGRGDEQTGAGARSPLFPDGEDGVFALDVATLAAALADEGVDIWA